jgi:SOS response regulatory protein OraA/RecX
MARGVEKRVIEEALAGLPEEDESAAITKFLERKRYPDNPTALERQKVFLQLLRKGFSSAAISRMLKPKGAKRG